MTDVRMALARLLEKGSDADLLREMVGYVAQRLMELDIEGLCGAGHGESSSERENWRNGYRDGGSVSCCGASTGDRGKDAGGSRSIHG